MPRLITVLSTFAFSTILLTISACSVDATVPSGPGLTGASNGDGGGGPAVTPSGEQPCHRYSEHYNDKLCENFASSGLYTYTCGDKSRPEKALQCIGSLVNGYNCCKVDRPEPVAVPEAGAPGDAGASPSPEASIPVTPHALTLDDLVGKFDFSSSQNRPYKSLRTMKTGSGSYYLSFTYEYPDPSFFSGYNGGDNSGSVTLVAADPGSIDVYITSGSCGGAGCMVPLTSQQHYICKVSFSGLAPKRTLTLECGPSSLSATYHEQ